MSLEFRLLGELAVMRAGGEPLDPGDIRERKILAMLAVKSGHPVSLMRLIDAVWEDDPPRTAARQVQNAVSRLRARLGRDVIARTGGGYRLAAAPDAVDCLAFARLTAQARQAVQLEAIRLLRQAMTLWRGPFLDGMDLAGELSAAAAAYAEQRRVAQDTCYGHLLDIGRHEEITGELAGLQAAEPLRESTAGQLMLALYRCGRPQEALAVYDDVRRSLGAELGIEPGSELRELRLRILAHDAGLSLPVAASAPAPSRQPPADAHGAHLPACRTLPAESSLFTGRTAELGRLLKLASGVHPGDGSAGTAVCVIDGMAGVGKSSLALRLAHSLGGRFPGERLFIDLHGHTDGLPPRTPHEALEVLLRSAGVTPAQIPPDPDSRAAIYRDRLAETGGLILLDNAADESQVRPLLPGAGGCLVLITSRRRLKALDDACSVSLDVLPMTDAVELLRRAATLGRAEPADDVAEQIADRCGRLPLALCIAAALVRHRPAGMARQLAAELGQDRANLDSFFDGDRSLAAVFDLSYRRLDTEQKLLFRRLGLSPGAEADAYAAAALTGLDPRRAAQLLIDLVDRNLLDEPVLGRFRMHDLVRMHARTLSQADSADQRTAALGRLLDYYQHTAGVADSRIARHARDYPAGPAPSHQPSLPDLGEASAWLRAERANLLACIKLAAGEGWDERTVALTAGVASLLSIDGPLDHAVELHGAAVDAARHLGDQLAQAHALRLQGSFRRAVGDHPQAMRDLEQAEVLFRAIGERRDEAHVLTQLGILKCSAGDHAGAMRHLRTALRLSRELGDRPGQAISLSHLGVLRRKTGDHAGAVRDLEAALALCRELGDRLGEAFVLVELGVLQRVLGQYADAGRSLVAGARIYRDLSSVNGRAHALAELGVVQRMTADYTDAARNLETALGLFRAIGARSNEVSALNDSAAVFAAMGDLPKALDRHSSALSLARQLGQLDEQAIALEGLGECDLQAGDVNNGISRLNQALAVFRQLANPADTERVQTRLTALATRTDRV